MGTTSVHGQGAASGPPDASCVHFLLTAAWTVASSLPLTAQCVPLLLRERARLLCEPTRRVPHPLSPKVLGSSGWPIVFVLFCCIGGFSVISHGPHSAVLKAFGKGVQQSARCCGVRSPFLSGCPQTSSSPEFSGVLAVQGHSTPAPPSLHWAAVVPFSGHDDWGQAGGG